MNYYMINYMDYNLRVSIYIQSEKNRAEMLMWASKRFKLPTVQQLFFFSTEQIEQVEAKNAPK